MSWGATNGYDDVMDWYDITFKDNTQNEYWYNGKWHPTQKVVEAIHIKDKSTYFDTITYTHHGPVVWDYPHQTPPIGKTQIRHSVPQTSAGVHYDG